MVDIKHVTALFTITYIVLVDYLLLINAKERDYYEILGIERSASRQEIKKAFRNMALKYHPDKNKEKNAEAKFREIAKAYETLSDDNLRRQYDQLGHNSYEQNSRHSNGPGNSGDDNFNYNKFYENWEEFMKQHNDAHARAHEQARRHHEKIVREQHGFHFDFNFFDDLFDDNENIFSIHGQDHNQFNGFPSSELFNNIKIERCKFSFLSFFLSIINLNLNI